MKRISIVTNESTGNKEIQYMHSDNPSAINLTVKNSIYKEIQEYPIGEIKGFIERILLNPDSVNETRE